MYLKLRPDVYVAPSDEGALLFVDGKKTLLKGSSLLALVERLVPFLDGSRTLEEITAPLPEERKRLVRQLLTRMLEVHALRDVSEDRQVVLDEATARVYAASLGYLETLAEGARRRFAGVRAARVAVLGGGAAGRTLAMALWEAGVRQGAVELSEEDLRDAPWREELARHATVDPQVDWRLGAPGGADAGEGATLVVGLGTVKEVERMQARCLARGVPLLPLVYAEGFGTLGPVVRPGRAGCVRCVQARVTCSAPSLPPASPGWSLLGARAAVEAFKLLATLPSDLERGVLRIDGETLVDSAHPLPPVGDCPACGGAAAWPAEMGEAEPRELPGGHAAWVDAFSGVLASVEPGDWTQLPVSLWMARPRGEAPPVLAPGGTHESARARAVLAALAWELDERPPATARRGVVRGPAPTVLLEEASVADGAWRRAAGLSWCEWVGQGVLAHACHEVDVETRGRRLTEAELGTMDADAAFWWKTLGLRYDLEVEAWGAEHPALPVSVVRLVSAGQPLAHVAGRTPAEALKTALLQALGTVQAREVDARAEVRGTPPGGTERIEPVAPGTPSWREWLGRLGERRVYLALDPGAPSLREQGVFRGWVGLGPER